MDKNSISKFTPLGGANQDDSLVTPSPDAAGKSLFEVGDYRYALNARIGSSRSDNFGDIENIKGTIAKTNYVGYNRATWQNSPTNFPGSLSGWSVYNSGTDFAFSYGSISGVFGAKVNMGSSPRTTVTLFQVHNITAGDYLSISYAFMRTGVSSLSHVVKLCLVYLDASGVEIASTQIDDLNSYSPSIGHPSNTVNLFATQTCAAIGFKLQSVNSALNIDYLVDLFKIDHAYKVLVTTPPSGRNKVIGKFEDTEFQKIWKCVWNENNNHTLSYFDISNNTTYEILRWSGLNFLENSFFVKMTKLDNWIAFTDRRNPPRLIDVDTIQELFLKLGSTEFREFHISLHKWAPTVPLIPRVYYDTITNVNNYEKLKNRNFHFAYRYIYYGNLKSRWSPISKGAVTTSCGYYYGGVDKKITSIEVDMPGSIFNDPSSASAYNYFEHQDIKFTSAVQYIELAFRDGEGELWKQWKIVTVTPSINRYQYFDGNGTLTPLDQAEFEVPFDSVPFLAGTIEAVDNRFVLADVLDEQPAADPLSVSGVGIVNDPLNDWRDSYSTSFSTLAPIPRGDILKKNALSYFNFKDRGIYKIGIQWLHRNGWRSALYTTEAFTYNTIDNSIGSNNRLIAFNFSLEGTIPPDWAVGYQIFRTNVLNFEQFTYGIVNKFIPIIDDISVILDQIALPDNIKDRIRQHFENSRLVQGDEIVKEIERQVNAEIAADKAKNKNKNNLLKLNENIGKGSGMIELYASNRDMNKYLRSNSIAPKLLPELRKTKAINLTANASRIYIDINNWYFGSKSATDKENPLNKIFYNFKEGDRVRFVGSDVAAPTDASQLREYDVPILEFTGKGIIIERPSTMLYMQREGVPTGFQRYNIEVYTPKVPTMDDHLLYEIGEWYPVLYPGTVNKALAKTDFVYTNNAAVTASTYGSFNFFNKIPLFYGDCYPSPKTVYRDTAGPGAENTSYGSSSVNLSMTPDPDNTVQLWNQAWDRNNGRVSTTYQNIPVSKFKTTLARFGGKIIEQSFVNSLNVFRDEDQFLYPSEYGRIRNLINTSNAQVESVGSILLAIGEREAWSIYVNRTTLEDLSGNSQVGLSDQVLGSYNTLLGSHGTLNPESVSKYRGNVYYWDVLNGSWIRYGRDGLTPISDYKKRNWFKELATLLLSTYLTDTPPIVLSEFDPFNMELITFIDHPILPATFRGYSEYKGDTFSENDKRWKSCHSYNPEMFVKMNNQVYSFKGGIIYQHEADDAYNTFYGTKFDSKIEPVFNVGSDIVKHWRTISIMSTDGWSVERILSEYRGNKNLLESRIPLGSFVRKEDTYWAPIKQDINTPNVANPVINGNPIKCKVIQVLMTLDPSVTYLSLMHYAFASFDESKINP